MLRHWSALKKKKRSLLFIKKKDAYRANIRKGENNQKIYRPTVINEFALSYCKVCAEHLEPLENTPLVFIKEAYARGLPENTPWPPWGAEGHG